MCQVFESRTFVTKVAGINSDNSGNYKRQPHTATLSLNASGTKLPNVSKINGIATGKESHLIPFVVSLAITIDPATSRCTKSITIANTITTAPIVSGNSISNTVTTRCQVHCSEGIFVFCVFSMEWSSSAAIIILFVLLDGIGYL